MFGIGGGGIPEATPIMGVDFRRRWDVAGEYVRAMKELWTKEESSFQGEFVRFPPVRCFPKPRQKPHPPIHIGAGGITPNYRRALRNTAAFGDGWAPLAIPPDRLAKDLATLKELCAQAGRDFAGDRDFNLFSRGAGRPPTDATRLRASRRASAGLQPVGATNRRRRAGGPRAALREIVGSKILTRSDGSATNRRTC